MKKFFASLMVVLSLLTVSIGSASAASGYGVSTNTSKANYYQATETEIPVYTKNDNSYEVFVQIVPQHYVNGVWKEDLPVEWGAYLSPEETNEIDIDITGEYEGISQKGTYRLKNVVWKNDVAVGTFYTANFYVK